MNSASRPSWSTVTRASACRSSRGIPRSVPCRASRNSGHASNSGRIRTISRKRPSGRASQVPREPRKTQGPHHRGANVKSGRESRRCGSRRRIGPGANSTVALAATSCRTSGPNISAARRANSVNGFQGMRRRGSMSTSRESPSPSVSKLGSRPRSRASAMIGALQIHATSVIRSPSGATPPKESAA